MKIASCELRARIRRRLGPNVLRITLKASEVRELLDAIDAVAHMATRVIGKSVDTWNEAREISFALSRGEASK